MNVSTESSRSTDRGNTPGSRLRANALGLWGMVFLVVAAAAPLTAVASNLPLSLGIGAGVGTLGWIVVIGLLLIVFSSGYVALSRKVVSAGAYHAYVEYGLGRTAGGVVAYIADIAYSLASAAMVVAFGFFADLVFSIYAGFSMHWVVYSAAGLLIIAFLGHFGADLASVVTMIISVTQFALVGALAIAVIVQNPAGFGLAGFAPSEMSQGSFSLTAVLILLLFGGYEAAAAHGEEAKAPYRNVRRATYIALLLLILIFLASTWTLIASFDDVIARAATDPGALLNAAATTYLGPQMGAVMSMVVALSFLAAAVAFHNMASRYSFSLGRAGLLPRALSRTTARRSAPATASATHVVIVIIVITPFVVIGADPLTSLFPAIAGVTSLAMIVLTTLCCLSVVVSSVQGRLPGSILATRIAPTVAGAGFVTLGALIVVNYQQVTGSESPVVALMPFLVVIGALAAVFAVRSSRGPRSQAESK